MKNFVIVTRPILSQAHRFYLGKGAKLNLELATKPMIKFLQQEYFKDKTCLNGDVEKLLSVDVDYHF